MRIVSGKYKGRRIVAPKNLPVRPTTDMAKEALFNILNNTYYFDEISVLDLFSGIGSISLEFGSRGTTDITAVDSNPGCVQFVDRIGKELDLGIHALRSDVFTFLDRTARTYDLIFADPPYETPQEKFLDLVNTIFERKILDPEGTLIVEHGKNTDLSGNPNYIRSRKYGSNIFSFFAWPESHEGT